MLNDWVVIYNIYNNLGDLDLIWLNLFWNQIEENFTGVALILNECPHNTFCID